MEEGLGNEEDEEEEEGNFEERNRRRAGRLLEFTVGEGVKRDVTRRRTQRREDKGGMESGNRVSIE